MSAVLFAGVVNFAAMIGGAIICGDCSSHSGCERPSVFCGPERDTSRVSAAVSPSNLRNVVLKVPVSLKPKLKPISLRDSASLKKRFGLLGAAIRVVAMPLVGDVGPHSRPQGLSVGDIGAGPELDRDQRSLRRDPALSWFALPNMPPTLARASWFASSA